LIPIPKYNPIFVASCKKTIGNRRRYKAFQQATGKKRKKVTQKNDKDASHDLEKLQTSKKKQIIGGSKS
jgi:hypothetical protein